MPTALITGITGQDGAYLAKLLIGKGYDVWGTVRETTQRPFASLQALGIESQVQTTEVDLTALDSLRKAIEIAAPDEIYNLAAQSSVARSFEEPTDTGEIIALGTARLLQAMRDVHPEAHFFQASSSEMYGQVREVPQTEDTAFYPRSPYGAAKVYAHWMTVNYREAYGCHASCGILFNHESPLRPERFVTRKITRAVALIKAGLQSELVLGNLDVERDWGFAGDYVEAMWKMLQHDQPDDYILATGQTHSLKHFVDLAFGYVGLQYEEFVKTDAQLLRPTEVNSVVGSNQKAKTKLDWTPKMSFEQLVGFMVEADLKRVRHEEHLIQYTQQ